MEIRLTASKSKLHISASKSEKSIKISAYLCDGGVRFEQVATKFSSVGNFPDK